MTEPPIAIWRAALNRRRPQRKKRPLFRGLPDLRSLRPNCSPDLAQTGTGDTGAVIVIMVVAAIVAAMARWVHARLRPAVTLPPASAIVWPVKAALVAGQSRHRAPETAL